MTSLVDAESVLAIDIGSLNTRALLLDVVDGNYHFVAASAGPTTAGAPFYDISEGVHIALSRLQEITGRTLIGSDALLIVPSQPDGSGVDRLALTISAGEDFNIVTMGLLADVSMQSAQRLAGSTYGKVVDTISLTDRRRPEAQLDALLQARPDIVIISGGTERGATRSVGKLAELVTLACRVLPRDHRPKVLYCGNGALAKRIKEMIERETPVVVAPNIRPSIDQEDLMPAQSMLSKMAAKLRVQRMSGLAPLASLSSAPMQPSAYALGRMMRFFSKLTALEKPSLGADLGASTTTLAVANNGELQLNVFRPWGVGPGLQAVLQQSRIQDIYQWVAADVTIEDVRDYLYQKSVYPATLPMTPETLSIEQALARHVLRQATLRLLERWPSQALSFERIFLSGAVLAQAPSPWQSLMMALDGIQPVGANIISLDPYGLSQAMGAIAGSNTLLPAQIIESGAYVNLGTVICPVSDARPGSTILRVKITYEDGAESRVEVKQGMLAALPVRNGQVVTMVFEPQRGTVIDPLMPRIKTYRGVTGGLCGVVVDARGRPLQLTAEPNRRRETLARWAQPTLLGQPSKESRAAK